jgi:sRNA-binding carbon storage regulator CsrA
MLVVMRRIGETLRLDVGGGVELTVQSVDGRDVRIACSADRRVAIDRRERRLEALRNGQSKRSLLTVRGRED